MENIQAKIRSFLWDTPHLDINSLTRGKFPEATEHPPRSRFHQTNLAFIQRLVAESNFVLAYDVADGIPCAFTEEQIKELRNVHDLALAALDDAKLINNAIASLKNGMPVIQAIAAHFEQHMEAMALSRQQIALALARETTKYFKCLRDRDFDSLIDFHPQKASEVFDGGKTVVPKRGVEAFEFLRKRMAKAFSAVDIEKLAEPEILRAYAREESSAAREEKRSGAILTAIRDFTSRLDFILNPPEEPPRPADVIKFPSRQPFRIIRGNG